LCPNWLASVRCCPGYVTNTQRYNQTIIYDDGRQSTRLVSNYCCSNGTVSG
jgi:hypothetical protein